MTAPKDRSGADVLSKPAPPNEIFASETRFRKCDECIDVETCGTRIVMKEVRDAVAEILERTTLASVCCRVDEAKAAHFQNLT